MTKRLKKDISSKRRCQHCGGRILGIGWGIEKLKVNDGEVIENDWCSVICRTCSARGPACKTEDEAWPAFNARLSR